MKISVFIATSLDGFIAREDGDLDWLNAANKGIPEGEDCGFQKFMAPIDVLIMGRITFEKVIELMKQGEEWPYGRKHIFVLSRNILKIPNHLVNRVSHTREPPIELVKRLRDTGVKNIYVDGGFTIRMFLEQNLIDEITITTIPIILGSGIPLFQGITKDVPLKHLKTKIYEFGFVQSTWKVIKKRNKMGIRKHSDFMGKIIGGIIQDKPSET